MVNYSEQPWKNGQGPYKKCPVADHKMKMPFSSDISPEHLFKRFVNLLTNLSYSWDYVLEKYLIFAGQLHSCWEKEIKIKIQDPALEVCPMGTRKVSRD